MATVVNIFPLLLQNLGDTFDQLESNALYNFCISGTVMFSLSKFFIEYIKRIVSLRYSTREVQSYQSYIWEKTLLKTRNEKKVREDKMCLVMLVGSTKFSDTPPGGNNTHWRMWQASTASANHHRFTPS